MLTSNDVTASDGDYCDGANGDGDDNLFGALRKEWGTDDAEDPDDGSRTAIAPVDPVDSNNNVDSGDTIVGGDGNVSDVDDDNDDVDHQHLRWGANGADNSEDGVNNGATASNDDDDASNGNYVDDGTDNGDYFNDNETTTSAVLMAVT